MDPTNIVLVGLDFPCRELSARGLGFVVALSNFCRIVCFVRIYWGSNSAVLLVCSVPSKSRISKSTEHSTWYCAVEHNCIS